MSENKPIIKCAIYTRKSSEEGLEQDFNSLHAQREACEAYIKSQKHEGWEFIEKHYDDGGYSGGNIDRPALKELLADVAAGLVNIIVVYKIDRLTRSLHDFSKIVEVLDKTETSFVSITQHFNTTTSMGRLTLNMLLSFAQFEREVTGERIRDKYAASKQKGMWMGGVAPLGYCRQDKKLLPTPLEAQKIELIFEKYIELKSVHLLKEYLDDNSIFTRNNNKFVKGILYHILANRVYIGEVPHSGKWYKGLHESIVSPEIFAKAQEILQENRIKDRSIANSKDPSLLAGKIFDDKGNYMSPSHSNKNGKRYKYYLSQAVIRHDKQKIGNVTKIAAGEIEKFVTETIKEIFKNKERIQDLFKNMPIKTQKELLKKAQEILPTPQIIRDAISKVKLFKEKVEIMYYPEYIKEVLLSHYETRVLNQNIEKHEQETIIKDLKIAIVDNGSKIIIGADVLSNNKQEDSLIRLILKAYKWNNMLIAGQVKSAKNIAVQEKVHYSYLKKILKLAFISPNIVKVILNGTQPRDLTVGKLFECNMGNWAKQEEFLGVK